jgi:hypothetical protein
VAQLPMESQMSGQMLLDVGAAEDAVRSSAR